MTGNELDERLRSMKTKLLRQERQLEGVRERIHQHWLLAARRRFRAVQALHFERRRAGH